MTTTFLRFTLAFCLFYFSNSSMTQEVTRPATLNNGKNTEYFRSSLQRISALPSRTMWMTDIYEPETKTGSVDNSMRYFWRAPWYRQDVEHIGSHNSYVSAIRDDGSQTPSKTSNFRSHFPETSLPRDPTFKMVRQKLPKGYHSTTNRKTSKQINADLVLTLLKLSIPLRDNMVKTFAFILYGSSFRLSLDLHESLREIYRATRNKLISTCDLIFSIRDHLFLDSQAQFIRIFEWLENYGPRYISGEVKLWLDALKNRDVSIPSAIMTENGLLTIDFLENMRENISQLKQNEIRLIQTATLGSHKATKTGNFVEYITRSMREGYLKITLPLIGSLLMHLHVSTNSPEIEEAVRYLTDVTYQNKNEMHFAVENISVHDMKDPYTLANAVLTKLENMYESYSLVSESVAMILPYLRPPNLFVSNRNHQIMSEILKLGEIDFSLLFREISPNDYPRDIIQSKELLLHTILNDEVNMKPFFKDFIPHEYIAPGDLLVSVVDRIKRRVKLPQHLKDHIDALSSHLKVKYDAIKMKSRKSQGLFYIIHLFDAFKSPSLPLYVRKAANDVLQDLRDIHVNWDNELEQFSPNEQSRPRAMVVKLLQSLLHNGFCERSREFLKPKISGFLDLLHSDGEPAKCHPKGCRLPNVITEVRSFVRSKDGNIITDDKKSIHQINITHLMSDLGTRFEEDSNYNILREFLFSAEFSEIIEPFDPSLFLTTTDLLRNLTRRSLKSPVVQNDAILNATITAYKRNLEENMYNSKPISWLRPEGRIINMGDILKTVEKKILHKDQHLKNLHRVGEFLARDVTPKELLHFDFQCLHTKSDFLRGLLDYLLTLSTLSENVKYDITVVKQYTLDDNKHQELLGFSKVC